MRIFFTKVYNETFSAPKQNKIDKIVNKIDNVVLKAFFSFVSLYSNLYWFHVTLPQGN